MQFKSSLSLYQCTLLPICTVATVQLLYAIQILTDTISVHTVTNMYGSHSTVAVCNSNSLSSYSQFHCPVPSLTNLPATRSAQFQLSPLLPPFSVSQSISLATIRAAGFAVRLQNATKLPLYSEKSIPATRPTKPPIQWVFHDISPAIKRMGREADHSPYIYRRR